MQHCSDTPQPQVCYGAVNVYIKGMPQGLYSTTQCQLMCLHW